MLKLLGRSNVSNSLIVLSGDVHHAEVTSIGGGGKNSDSSKGFTEITASGLTHSCASSFGLICEAMIDDTSGFCNHRGCVDERVDKVEGETPCCNANGDGFKYSEKNFGVLEFSTSDGIRVKLYGKDGNVVHERVLPSFKDKVEGNDGFLTEGEINSFPALIVKDRRIGYFVFSILLLGFVGGLLPAKLASGGGCSSSSSMASDSSSDSDSRAYVPGGA